MRVSKGYSWGMDMANLERWEWMECGFSKKQSVSFRGWRDQGRGLARLVPAKRVDEDEDEDEGRLCAIECRLIGMHLVF